jgi:hypothetical protein
VEGSGAQELETSLSNIERPPSQKTKNKKTDLVVYSYNSRYSDSGDLRFKESCFKASLGKKLA